MLRKALIGLAAIVVVLVLVISSRPSTFHVERSITVAASPESAFAQVNDFHKWTAWSPYENLDPELRRTYQGAPSGVGAVYGWAGNGKAGEGRMTITTSDAPSRIGIQLEFIKPFAGNNTATFTFVPTAEGTKVTWALDGTSNFVSKAFSLVFDVDKLVGGDFDKGLAALKDVAEHEPNTQTAQAR